MDPTPGWTPPILNETLPECLRQAFSCAAGVHPIKLPFIDPLNLSTKEFYDRWEALIREHNFDVLWTSSEYAAMCEWPYWIAIVPSLTTRGATHAIVMKAGKLHFDSATPGRKRRPTKIFNAMVLRPT